MNLLTSCLNNKTVALVGYTGFVGSNILESGEDFITNVYNSKNIEVAFNTRPDVLIYAGVPSEMFTANSDPEKDLAIINNAFDQICRINPKKLVLISTIAVYDKFDGVDELHDIDETKLKPYGANRLVLEDKVRMVYPSASIIRLPALYGNNLKKNFIYDMLHYFVPGKLTTDKYDMMSSNEIISKYYAKTDEKFYKCTARTTDEYKLVGETCETLGFTAKAFTDHRAAYQFFNLKYLFGIICKCISENIQLLTITSEPVTAEEVYTAVTGKHYYTELPQYPMQDLRTRYADNGYMFSKKFVLDDIIKYAKEYSI